MMRRNPTKDVPRVVYHGSPYAFDSLRPSATGILWFALTPDMADMFSVHRHYADPSTPFVWEVELSEKAKFVRLDDLSDPIVREIKNRVAITKRLKFGGSIEDSDWWRYANFDLVENDPWVIKFLRSKRISGAIVRDHLRNIPFLSLALWNIKAIVSSRRVPIDESRSLGARTRLRDKVAPIGISAVPVRNPSRRTVTRRSRKRPIQ